MSSSSDSDSEVEEDYRIAKLYGAADKSTPLEFAALVDQLGTKDAIVYGGMCTDAPSARAHFVLMALLDADDGTVVECLEARLFLLKAVVAAGGDKAGFHLIAALEGRSPPSPTPPCPALPHLAAPYPTLPHPAPPFQEQPRTMSAHPILTQAGSAACSRARRESRRLAVLTNL